MTDPLDEYGIALRRALHAEADAVVPAADGLERIRARISEKQGRPFGWAWFTETWSRPALALGAAAAVAAVAVVSTPAIESITAGGEGPANRGGPDHSITSGADAPGRPAYPGGPSYPGDSTSPSPSSTPSPLPSPQAGTATCAPPKGTRPQPSAAPSRGRRPVPRGGSPCTPPPAPPSPTPDPVVTSPSEPSSSSEPPTPSSPPAAGQQQADVDSAGDAQLVHSKAQ
jgi:hypothetical protein